MASLICDGMSNGFEDGEDVVVMLFLNGRRGCGTRRERGGRLNNAVSTDVFVRNENPKTLGAEGQKPRGQIEIFFWSFKQFTHHKPSRQILNFFEKAQHFDHNLISGQIVNMF